MRAQLFVLALHAFINHDRRGSRELYSAISLAKWRGIGHNLVASPKIYTPLDNITPVSLETLPPILTGCPLPLGDLAPSAPIHHQTYEWSSPLPFPLKTLPLYIIGPWTGLPTPLFSWRHSPHHPIYHQDLGMTCSLPWRLPPPLDYIRPVGLVHPPP